MTFPGIPPQNHPQQVRTRGARDAVDERITPDDVFWHFNKRFLFTLDAAANASNAKIPNYFDKEADGLAQPWAPHRVWCNPPYSNLFGWMDKAHTEFESGCPVIVMLLPACRTEQPWWQIFVEPYRDKPDGWLTTEFLRSRINFGMPGNVKGRYKSTSPFGCVAVIFGDKNS